MNSHMFIASCMPKQKTKQTSILKIINFKNEVGIQAIKSSETRDEQW